MACYRIYRYFISPAIVPNIGIANILFKLTFATRTIVIHIFHFFLIVVVIIFR